MDELAKDKPIKTYDEQFQEALTCKNAKQAKVWLHYEILEYQNKFKIDAKAAKKTILHNLGYMTGYYDESVAKKIHELFGIHHPLLGDLSKATTEQAFLAGVEFAKKHSTKPSPQ